MKILIDARLYGLENAGLGRYVLNLVNELSIIDKKNDYSILLTKKYFNELKLPANWKKIEADFRHYSVTEQIKLPGILKKEAADVVHFPHFNVPILYNGQFVVTIHDLLMHKNFGLSATTLSAPLYLIKRTGYKATFRQAVTRASKIIVPSNAVKSEVIKFYKTEPVRIKVIYEGVGKSISVNGADILKRYNIQDRYFIYVGNAYPHKNLKRLIEAIVLLNKNIDQKILLLIVSARNIFTQKLQSEIKKAKAEKFVQLLGFVSDSELGPLYKNSLGFVFPSLSEGFGLPGLEAMRSGTLVLASNIPVFKEIYKDNAIYFNPLDFSSIEHTMRNVILYDTVKRKERIKVGTEFAKKFSWAKMAEETLKVYEDSYSLRSSK